MARVNKHLLLIGFGCTGKTSLGRSAFQGENVIDSDDKILKWIETTQQEKFDHIYQIYIRKGREEAIRLIQQAEQALITKWAGETSRKLISLGPGFPFREGWSRLRARSHVILFRRSPQGIYESFKERRKAIFTRVPRSEEP